MEKFWIEHAYLLYVGFFAGFGFICYLINKMVDQSIKNMDVLRASIKDLYTKHNDLSNFLYEFHGEHQGVMGNYDPNSHFGRRSGDSEGGKCGV